MAVELSVTPDITVPAGRLQTTYLRERVGQLAMKESQKGLVDAGGVFAFDADAVVLAQGHPHGFIAAATAAFANHYPFAIRPPHFRLMILQAIAIHVEKSAEEVRHKWVEHEGKKDLLVRCDDFVFGGNNDWSSVVDGKPDSFSSQIDQNVVEGLSAELAPAFSNTTAVENIAQKITVMDATKSFFSFKCKTDCGFPHVIMEGSLEDWLLLRSSAQALITERCEEHFASSWCAALLPLLDIFVNEYAKAVSKEGHPDEQFWNSMCKRGGTSGSGAYTWFNGWINILFPYIKEQPNPYMVPYSSDNGYVREGRNRGRYGMFAPKDVRGPDCQDFPEGLAAAPVVWDYNGTEIKLKFKAGFVGAQQDEATGTISPTVGWFICHDDGDDAAEGKGKGKGKGEAKLFAFFP